MSRLALTLGSIAWLLLGAELLGAGATETGIVVESLFKGDRGHASGMREGDRLVAWEVSACPSNGGRRRGGEIATAFDLNHLEAEEAPRCPLTLRGWRASEAASFTLPDGDWGVTARPVLDPEQLAQHERARERVAAGQLDEALSEWRLLAERLRADGRPRDACWAWRRVADAAARARRWPDADGAFAAARELARSVADPRLEAMTWIWEGAAHDRVNDLPRAESAYQEALRLVRALGPNSLWRPRVLRALSIIVDQRGDLARGISMQREALAWQSRLAPSSLGVERCLNALGNMTRKKGDLRTAARLLTEALAIAERLGPAGESDAAGVLNNLSGVAHERGDLAAAESLIRRSLRIFEIREPDSARQASALHNLGALAHSRGDPAAAETSVRAALAIIEKTDPDGLVAARMLDNLGLLIRGRGELDPAEDLLRRGLALRQRHAPDGLDVARSYEHLGELMRLRGDPVQAEQLEERALALKRKVAPGSVGVAESLRLLALLARDRRDHERSESLFKEALAIYSGPAAGNLERAEVVTELGEVAFAAGDLQRAEALHREALATQVRMLPGSAPLAHSWHGLASVLWRTGRKVEAAVAMANALTALEAQQCKLGGSEDARSSFATRYAAYYHEAAELHLELGHRRQAFHVIERSRARGLLALLAERDLVFTDIPVELDGERRRIAAEYDRAQAKVAGLDPRKDGAAIEKLLAGMRDLRSRRSTLEARVRSASPRFASIQYPRPLDVARVRATLDPGTLLLSYSVGPEKTLLFVVASGQDSPGGDGLSVLTLPIGESQLRQRIVLLRGLIEQGQAAETGSEALREPAARLYDDLLRPAQQAVSRARRLLIAPDGPLHMLPFAVLVASTAPARYLVEMKPLHTILSATLYAEVRGGRSRRPAPEPRTLVAFGDPVYAQAAGGAAPGVLREAEAARTRGLKPLPASRDEVQRVTGLFGSAATAYLGPEASEERARALGQKPRYVHFAVHGILDRRFPLDSALALSAPVAGVAGRENGLLQAWEIFESVRLAADLVTLSACETGLGREAGGEGLISLSRAFHYAGARSVLASLWPVSDRSTPELMVLFYRGLARGLPKDEALQAAQVQALRGSMNTHPFHWAAFQLSGDWR